MTDKRKIVPPTLDCGHCGKTVVRSKLSSRGYNYAQRFCSRQCVHEHLRETMPRVVVPSFECERCGKTSLRTRNPGGRINYEQRFCSKRCAHVGRTHNRPRKPWIITRDGYRYISSGRGALTAEHRIVMEQAIGRPLRKGETVHHKNGIRDDNRSENLELWASNHGPGQRVSDLEVHFPVVTSDYLSGVLSFGA